MAKLNAARRKALPKSKFAIPEKAPGPGSYPIDTRGRASVALGRSEGKPEQARVKRAVCAAYPDLPECQTAARSKSTGGKAAGGRKGAPKRRGK